MLISIIIPIYNVADYIKRALLAALNQQYPDIEILLVDDCSTDQSMNIVDSVLATHPRSQVVQIIHHPNNKGLSEARNSGLKHAKGEYVFFLDSDDAIPEDCLSNLVAPVGQFYPQCIVGDYEVSDPTRYKKAPLFLKEGYYHGPEIINKIYLKRKMMYGMVWNKLYKRTFLIENNLFFKEGIYHEDELWSFQLFTLLDSIFMVRKVSYLYEIRPTSISQKISSKRQTDQLIITHEMDKWMKEHIDLLNNKKLIQFFEDWKNKLFRTMIRAEFDEASIKRYYNELRRIQPVSPYKLFFYRCSFKQFVRKIHYLTNPQKGLQIMKYLMK
ncbi:MAG: glycosyltransferase family 2 protein [Bacteroidales bacterium]